MGAEGDERMAREGRELLLRHHEILDDRLGVDADCDRRAVEPFDRRVLALGADHLGHAAKGRAHLGAGADITDDRLAAAEVHPPLPAEDRRGRLPPDGVAAFGKSATDEDGKGNAMPFEDRQRMVAIVAVAVVEGEGGEGPSRFRRVQNGRDLFERHEPVTVGLQLPDRGVEEFRRDLEMRVDVGRGRNEGPDVMQREDRAEPARRRHRARASQEVRCFEPGSDDAASRKLLQHGFSVLHSCR